MVVPPRVCSTLLLPADSAAFIWFTVRADLWPQLWQLTESLKREVEQALLTFISSRGKGIARRLIQASHN
jgi:hypothetical protein